MEKEGRGPERPQSWKCPSVGLGSKMEVVLTAPHISYRAQGEGALPGSVAHAPMGVGGKPGSGVPTHSLETSEEWRITMQSGHRSNPTLSPKEGGSHRPLLRPPSSLHLAEAGAGAKKGPGWGFPRRFPGGKYR